MHTLHTFSYTIYLLAFLCKKCIFGFPAGMVVSRKQMFKMEKLDSFYIHFSDFDLFLRPSTYHSIINIFIDGPFRTLFLYLRLCNTVYNPVKKGPFQASFFFIYVFTIQFRIQLERAIPCLFFLYFLLYNTVANVQYKFCR